jgi:hypothetical protein
MLVLRNLSRKELAYFYKGVIGFNITRLNNKRVEFTVYHNLGARITDAIQCWSVRTRRHTAESLCQYINDKYSGDFCFTEEQWEPYQKKLFGHLNNKQS